jgi:hypothetical protein
VDSGVVIPESLGENRRSAGIYTPHQRLKRLNYGHRLANVSSGAVEHMRNCCDGLPPPL